ncbi:MAG: response regulator [Betaproteobacteria bacterium]|nr:response regulator [Betaproteobacteria bacterium]
MRLILIDDNADFRMLLGQLLCVAIPGVEVEEWAAESRGHPPADMDWSAYSAVLLDHELGSEDGADWLQEFREHGMDLPPLLFLAGKDAVASAVRAMKLGALDVLMRGDLNPVRLAAALGAAVREQEARRELRRQDAAGERSRPRVLEAQSIGTEIAGDIAPIRGYRIQRMIGEGATAKVYLAEPETGEGHVVLKVLEPSLCADPDFMKRFAQEFKLISRVKSENVSRIYGQGLDNGRAFIAMEYFGAGDLRERIGGGMDPMQALKILAQLAKGLEAIHQAGIIHRDLKPHNVMFRDEYNAAIVDFGAAKDLNENLELTRMGDVFGTPYYMSPEQVCGEKLDERSDLYSLGVIFYQMLTGRHMFEANTAAGIAAQHLTAEPPPLPEAYAGLQRLYSRLTAKDRQARFKSAQDLYGYIAV